MEADLWRKLETEDGKCIRPKKSGSKKNACESEENAPKLPILIEVALQS